MTDRILKAIPVAALVILLGWAIWKLVSPEINLRQTVAQNVVLAAQVVQLQQQAQAQNQAFAVMWQNPETRAILEKNHKGLFQPVQPSASNGTLAR